MARVAIITAGHVSTSPRVWREAQALSAAGHDVTVVGAWLSDQEAQMDLALSRDGSWQLVVGADMRARRGTRWNRTAARIRRRLARYAASAGVPNMDALTYAPRAILSAVRSIRADLYIGHLLTGMWVAHALLADGKRIAIDVEDWHSEELPPSETLVRPYAAKVEQRVLRRAAYCSTTSRAMATSLAERYGLPEPHVVYNSDPTSLLPTISAAPTGPLRMIWFSQTLGGDRGLDDAWCALSSLGDGVEWDLALLCNSTAAARTEQLDQLPASLRPRVRFEGYVPPSELPRIVSGYDVGLALEQPSTRNRDLTIANKMFRYLQSGVFVAATATAGQTEVLRDRHALGRLYAPRDHGGLSGIVAAASHTLPELRASRQRRADDATCEFAYETQARVLVAAVQSALTYRSSPSG